MASTKIKFPTTAPGVGSGLRGLTGQPFASYTPYQPPPLPSGTYDPALDAQRQAAARGLQDTEQDTSLAGSRATEDYGLGYDQLFQQGVRENQNYATNVAALTKNYGNLATSQGEQDNQYGVLPGGGAALQAAAKRAANQATDQAALDTTHNRNVQDINTGFGQLALGYDRGVTDRTTTLARAGREDTQFGLDTGAEEAFQAGQAGYTAPGRGETGGIPTNEFVDANGNHRKIVTTGGVRYVIAPDGSVISQQRVSSSGTPLAANVAVGSGRVPPKKAKK